MDKVSMSRYQTKCVIEFLFRQLMTSQTLKFIFDQPLKAMADREKKREGGYTKNCISRKRKELFR